MTVYCFEDKYMKDGKRQTILQGLAVLLADVLTIWMMIALYYSKAIFFPWSISYLFLSAGLVTISMLFYRSLARDISRNFAISFVITSFVLWGYTVAITFIASFFPISFLYHGAFFLGLVMFVCYNMTVIRRMDKRVQKNSNQATLKGNVSENRGPEVAALVLNLGDSMVALRPYLLPEDYTNLEKIYWEIVDSVKDLPPVSQESPQNRRELEKNMAAKLAEIPAHMKLIPDASGDKQRILITEIVTSLVLVKNFAENLQRLCNS